MREKTIILSFVKVMKIINNVCNIKKQKIFFIKESAKYFINCYLIKQAKFSVEHNKDETCAIHCVGIGFQNKNLQ